MDGQDLFASNSFEEPDKVKPRNIIIDNNAVRTLDINITKLSWNLKGDIKKCLKLNVF